MPRLAHHLGAKVREAPLPHVDREAELRDQRTAREVQILRILPQLRLRQAEQLLVNPGRDAAPVSRIHIAEGADLRQQQWPVRSHAADQPFPVERVAETQDQMEDV